MRIELLIACALVACTRPAPAPSPPANRAPVVAPVKPCEPDLTWFPRVRYLRYSEYSHGHFGEWRFHADFYRLDGEAQFHGVATGSYREHHSKPIRSAAREVTLPTVDVVKLLVILRDGITTPPVDSEDRRSIVDTSRSMVIQIEAMAFDPRIGRHPNFYVQFFTEHGETSPQPWNIRGCAYDPPQAAQRLVQRTAEGFATTIGNPILFGQLSAGP